MEIANIVLEFTKVLAWPIVVIAALLIFRSEIKQLSKSLKRVKLPGGTELDWQQTLRSAEESARKVESSPVVIEAKTDDKNIETIVLQSAKYGLLSSTSNYDFDYYRDLAERDPNLSLAGLRMELERMLQNMAKLLNTSYAEKPQSAMQITRMLEKDDFFDSNVSKLIRSIVSLANAAIHGRDVSLADTERAIDSAESFLNYYLGFMNGAMDRLEHEHANNGMQSDAAEPRR